MITLKCKSCYREYSVRYAIGIRSKEHFCSRECYREYNRNGEVKKCLGCGKGFYVQGALKNTKFCSRACQSAYARVILTCKQCGTGFEVTKYWAKKGRDFCSYECSCQYKVGPRVHNYKGNHIACICLWCGSEFTKPESSLKYGEGKFCSASCRSRFTVCKQGGMVSSIELAVKDELEKYGEFYYHQYRIDKFLVDFYLPNRNLVIECDGSYWHSLEKNAKNDFKKDIYMAKAGIALVRLKEDDIRADCEGLLYLTLQRYPIIM